MSVTTQQLEERVTAMEQQMAQVNKQQQHDSVPSTPAERGAALLKGAARVHQEFLEGWTRALQQMGISGAPVGAEKLQKMMLEAGVKSENSEFSRELIEMREE